MSYQAQTWVDQVGVDLCQNGGEAFVLLRIANHCGPDLRGAYPSAATLARLCKMGRSTVLKHIRALATRRVLLPGDPALTDHLPADKRPPVYDLVGGHENGCVGAHTIRQECRTAAGVQSEHPSTSPFRAGARSEHPPKKRRSAGARSEHPSSEQSGAGDQNEQERVFKSSTNSSKELNFSLSGRGGNGRTQTGPASEAEAVTEERETASPEDHPTSADAAVPAQRQDEDTVAAQQAAAAEMLGSLPGRPGRDDVLDLLPLALEALAVGWTLPGLRSHLAAKCDPSRVFDLGAVYRKHLKRLPAAPKAGAAAGPAAASPTCTKCHGSGQAEDPQTFLPIGPCDCRMAKAPAFAAAS